MTDKPRELVLIENTSHNAVLTPNFLLSDRAMVHLYGVAYPPALPKWTEIIAGTRGVIQLVVQEVGRILIEWHPDILSITDIIGMFEHELDCKVVEKKQWIMWREPSQKS